jgi:hypothetical protein
VLGLLAPVGAAAAPRRIAYDSWDTVAELRSGALAGVRVADGQVVLADATRDSGSWTSPWTGPGFPLTELVASWDASTPAGSRIEVDVRGRTATGRRTSWDTLARWTAGDRGFARTSGGVQPAVPAYSQMTHRGHYPQYGNGGEAWCSPTATSMVLGYYAALPRPAEYSWVRASDRDRFVDHAARMTYDYAYEGTGNWPFNTAYAARYTDSAFVTRLRSLREAERFVAARIPLVASIAYGPGELDGSPISSTRGHLVVVVGFTSGGNVVVNDPAAATNAGVRRVYDRGQFENAWVPTTGGLVYVITHDRPLPARDGLRNW